MTSRQAKQHTARRDRRLAKASEWTRAGTSKPKIVGHHHSESHMPASRPTKVSRQAPAKTTKTVVDQGGATTSLGELLREALEQARAGKE